MSIRIDDSTGRPCGRIERGADVPVGMSHLMGDDNRRVLCAWLRDGKKVTWLGVSYKPGIDARRYDFGHNVMVYLVDGVCVELQHGRTREMSI